MTSKKIYFTLIFLLNLFSAVKSFSRSQVRDSTEIIDYYSNGNKKLEGWYIIDSTKSGEIVYLAVGKQIKYYKSGKIQGYQFFERGILHGEFVSYFENGNREKIFYYIKGKLEGPFTFYYTDGKIMRTGTFKNDKDFGISKKHYKNGQLASEEFYNEDGIQEGEVKYYNKVGHLIKTEILFNGKKKK